MNKELQRGISRRKLLRLGGHLSAGLFFAGCIGKEKEIESKHSDYVIINSDNLGEHANAFLNTTLLPVRPASGSIEKNDTTGIVRDVLRAAGVESIYFPNEAKENFKIGLEFSPNMEIGQHYISKDASPYPAFAIIWKKKGTNELSATFDFASEFNYELSEDQNSGIKVEFNFNFKHESNSLVVVVLNAEFINNNGRALPRLIIPFQFFNAPQDNRA